MERTTHMHIGTCPRCGSENVWLADTEVVESGDSAHFYEYMYCEECGCEYTNAYQLVYQYTEEDEG